MAYRLQKPCTDIQKMDFISEYNHRLGLEIKETETGFYALEKTEKMENGIPVLNMNYEQEQQTARKNIFEINFFKTSFGWVSKKIVLKDGEEKDFLSDILLQIKAALEMGIEVKIPVLKEPDFSMNQTDEYYKTLLTIIPVTEDFIKECLQMSLLKIVKMEEK